MLYQIRNAKEFDGDTRIKWFSDEYFDLVIWSDDGGRIVSFQLVYDKYGYPRALTWKEGRGYLHERVDDGDIVRGHKMTPVLLPDGAFERKAIAEKFLAHGAEIETGIAEFVYGKILAYRGA